MIPPSTSRSKPRSDFSLKRYIRAVRSCWYSLCHFNSTPGRARFPCQNKKESAGFLWLRVYGWSWAERLAVDHPKLAIIECVWPTKGRGGHGRLVAQVLNSHWKEACPCHRSQHAAAHWRCLCRQKLRKCFHWVLS